MSITIPISLPFMIYGHMGRPGIQLTALWMKMENTSCWLMRWRMCGQWQWYTNHLNDFEFDLTNTKPSSRVLSILLLRDLHLTVYLIPRKSLWYYCNTRLPYMFKKALYLCLTLVSAMLLSQILLLYFVLPLLLCLLILIYNPNPNHLYHWLSQFLIGCFHLCTWFGCPCH